MRYILFGHIGFSTFLRLHFDIIAWILWLKMMGKKNSFNFICWCIFSESFAIVLEERLEFRRIAESFMSYNRDISLSRAENNFLSQSFDDSKIFEKIKAKKSITKTSKHIAVITICIKTGVLGVTPKIPENTRVLMSFNIHLYVLKRILIFFYSTC